MLLIQDIQVSTGAQAQTLQKYSMQDRIVDSRNFIEQIKGPIFLEAVLALGTIEKPYSTLEGKDNPSILKDEFSSRTDPPIFISILPLVSYSSEINQH